MIDNLFTLIIPTYNCRFYYIERILDYYKDVSFNIIIVDSSQKKLKKDLGANISYIYTPELNYFEKLKHAIGKVKTPYVALCADDDFTTMSGINECLTFLENNKDYSSVQGNYFFFFNNPFPKFYTSPLENKLIVDQDLPSERLNHLFWNYTFLHYSVHRTGNLVKTFDLLVSLTTEFYGISQFLLDMICIIQGKHRILPIFFSAREESYKSATYTLKSINYIKEDPYLKQKLVQVLIEISSQITVKENIKDSEAFLLLMNIFENSPQFNSHLNEIKDTSLIKNGRIKKLISAIPKIDLVKENYSRKVHKLRRLKRHYFTLRKSKKTFFGNTSTQIAEVKKIKNIIKRMFIRVLFRK